MPEGDTVHLAAGRLDAALAGHRLVRGELRHPRWSTHDLAGRCVVGVTSVGKHLLTRFDDGMSLHTHLRMDGAWHVYPAGRRWRGPAHHVRAVLAVPEHVAVGFRLHDMALLPTTAEHRLIGHLGPDLLGDGWGPAAAAEAVRRLAAHPEREVGLALLDQTVLAGVGNLYKTEVCYLLGVSPWTPVGRVDAARAVALSRELLSRNAGRPEQSTTGDLGRHAAYWIFERSGQSCRRCGDVVASAAQGSDTAERIAYFCPTCQPGPHPPLRATAPRRPQHPGSRQPRW
ncbi:MAG: DNA glycosylase [Pseudonocardiaceae bacterium]|nr:DNA glycosylase [Pseudonocardiaceae bacterium]